MDKKQFELLKVVRKMELFRSLELEEARRVLRMCERRDFGPKQIVWESFDESTDMLMLISGKLVVKNSQGDRMFEILPGGSFGEMGCLTGHPRFVTSIAEKASVALSLHRKDLRQLATDDPALYVKILESAVDVLAHRLTDTEHASDCGSRRGNADGYRG